MNWPTGLDISCRGITSGTSYWKPQEPRVKVIGNSPQLAAFSLPQKGGMALKATLPSDSEATVARLTLAKPAWA
jgi:hypothetical protein